MLDGKTNSKGISIHTPVKGVTPAVVVKHTAFSEISIHTPVKGVTITVTLVLLYLSISIHTPVKGVTLQSF